MILHTHPDTLQFVGHADNKINQAIMKLGELEAPVEEVCGPGVDSTFDQLISALGHIARQKPKPLIDTIMFWRKSKGDAAIVAKQVANQVCVISSSIFYSRWEQGRREGNSNVLICY